MVKENKYCIEPMGGNVYIWYGGDFVCNCSYKPDESPTHKNQTHKHPQKVAQRIVRALNFYDKHHPVKGEKNG